MSGAALPRRAAVGRRAGAVDAALLLLAALAGWQVLAVRTQGVAISSPASTAAYAAALVATGSFWGHVGATGLAFLYALAISAALGLALGLILGLRRFAGEVAEPILASLYTIPKVTLYPVMLLVFGLGLPAKVAFGVIHGLIPITLFTLGAVRTMPPVLLRTARALRLGTWQTARTVLVPAAMPEIVAGLRVGFSLCLLGVLIGEMFASQRGLGFLLVNGLNMHNVRLTTAVTAIIVLFAVTANGLMLRLGRRLSHRPP